MILLTTRTRMTKWKTDPIYLISLINLLLVLKIPLVPPHIHSSVLRHKLRRLPIILLVLHAYLMQETNIYSTSEYTSWIKYSSIGKSYQIFHDCPLSHRLFSPALGQGTSIILHKSLTKYVNQTLSFSIPYRCCSIAIAPPGRPTTWIINIYLPQPSHIRYPKTSSALLTHLRSIPLGDEILLAGDFNGTPLPQIDRHFIRHDPSHPALSYSQRPDNSVLSTLRSRLFTHELVDTWRALHLGARDYSFSSK
jgi:hypothetical protein